MLIVNNAAKVGTIRCALFDFDGTISLLRREWQQIMVDYVVDCVGGEFVGENLRKEFAEYVKKTAGIATIVQMRGLAGFVRRYGNKRDVQSPQEYKKGYVKALKQQVHENMKLALRDDAAKEKMLVPGARVFLEELRRRGILLFLFSGTDHADVEEEMEFLGVQTFFQGKVVGAQKSFRKSSKGALIRSVILTHCSRPSDLLVTGDGPVEIKHGRRFGAITLGIASNEFEHGKINVEKQDRLTNAGADVIVPDFSEYEKIVKYLFP